MTESTSPSTPDEELIPELQTVRSQLGTLKEDVARLTEELTHEQFNWRPAPDRWSVAQCIDHLNVAGYLLLPKLDEAIERGSKRRRFGDPPFRYGFISRSFIRFNEPSSNFKMSTFSVYEPSDHPSLEKSEVVARFQKLQDEIGKRVEEANGLDLRRARAPSPASHLLRLSLGAWFAGTVAHEQRHLQQARQISVDTSFPAS